MIKKLCVSRHAGLKLNSIVLIQKLQIMYLDFFNPILSLLSLFDYHLLCSSSVKLCCILRDLKIFPVGNFLAILQLYEAPSPSSLINLIPNLYSHVQFLLPPSRDSV